MDLPMRCALKLEAAPPRFGQVRRIVQAKLRYWQLDPLIDPTVLALTELLANVHKHAEPDKRCTIEMSYLTHRLTVSVHDGDPRLPVSCVADPLSTCGRGLGIVAALCREWGAWPDEAGGKTVWFTLGASVTAQPATTPDTLRLPSSAALTLTPEADPVALPPRTASLN